MGVAVLPPQDCLKIHHHHVIYPAHKPRRNPNNPNPNNPNPNRSNRRRRNSPPPPPSGPNKPISRPTSPPVVGQIRILKRGEELADSVSVPEPVEEKPVRLNLGPVLDRFYAGSACVTSPPPSSLPLPAFFTKRNCGLSESHNLEIASELKRVLKLN